MIRSSIASNPTAAQRYVEGVLRLKDPAQFPWRDGLSAYDFFAFWHARTMMTLTPPDQSDRNAAHSGPAFLPWHRYMLLRFEELLRQAVDDESFRLPYWDWALDAELTDPTAAPLWRAELLGRFSRDDFRVRVAMNAAGRLVRTDRPLQRRLGESARLPSRGAVRAAIHDNPVYDVLPFNSDAAGFRNHVEGWIGDARLHNSVHVWIGGDMGLATSPNDPTFFLHHCQVDRIWAAWQRRWPSASYAPDQTFGEELLFHRVADSMYTFFDEEITPGQTLEYGGWYEYDTLDDLL